MKRRASEISDSSSQQESQHDSQGKRVRSREGEMIGAHSTPTQNYPKTEPSASSSDPSSSPSKPSSSAISLSRDLDRRISPKEPSSRACFTPTARPGFGKQGPEFPVLVNGFLVSLLRELTVYQYAVSITPEVPLKEDNASIIDQLINSNGELSLGKRIPVDDGGNSFYTLEPLQFVSKEFLVKLNDRDPRKDREFIVAVKFVCQTKKQFILVARSFFSRDLGKREKLRNGSEFWSGGIRPAQMGLSWNIDIMATLPVIDFVIEFLDVRDWAETLSESDIQKLEKALKGVKVEDTHKKETHQISELTSLPTDQLTSKDGEGNVISVVKDFEQRDNKTLLFANWPSIQAGTSRKPTYIPMEACKMVEGQRYAKKLIERRVTSLLRATRQQPSDRKENIGKIVQDDNYNKYRKELQLEISDEPASLDARLLEPPMIMYHPSCLEKQFCPQLGKWNMMNKKVHSGGKVDCWTCLDLSGLERNVVSNFLDELRRVCTDTGIEFAENPLIPIRRSSKPDTISEDLREISKQSSAMLEQMETGGKQLQLLIIILPESKEIYNTIKRICETELDIMSQCCKAKNISRLSNKQFLSNLALKINVKVGGRNNVLVDAFDRRLPLVTDDRTIIFGADVTHPKAGEASSPSVAAVVASMDWPEMTKYKALTSLQPHRKEIIEDLFQDTQDPSNRPGGLICDLLRAFVDSNKHKPRRIIFYRVGVSEGKFNEVLHNEVEAIYKACASIKVGYRPLVTFIVVQKGHHTRLFPSNQTRTDKSGNILPGTVVDTLICHPTEYDFYLCSHAGIQGTSRPTHYHVLLDENNFTPDGIQTLTNSLCYTYAPCTRSVSVVPPVLYAHKAAVRARCYYPNSAFDGSTIRCNTSKHNAQVQPLPMVKEAVKKEMYFC